MKPVITRRLMVDAIDRFRRAYGLVEWLESERAPAIPRDQPLYEMTDAWRRWLETNAEVVPGDLKPPGEVDEIHAYFMAICWHRFSHGKRTWSDGDWSVLRDRVFMPLSWDEQDSHRRMALYREVETLLQSKSQRNDDACVYVFAWWCAFSVKANDRSGNTVPLLWWMKRELLAPRLNISEVWPARRRLLLPPTSA